MKQFIDPQQNGRLVKLEAERWLKVIDKTTGFETPANIKEVAVANFCMCFDHFIKTTIKVREDVEAGVIDPSDIIEACLQPVFHATSIYFALNGKAYGTSVDLLDDKDFAEPFKKLADLFGELGLNIEKPGGSFRK